MKALVKKGAGPGLPDVPGWTIGARFNIDERLRFNWSWSKVDLIPSLQGVLDGLDPAKRHDERNGVMQPV